MKRMLFICLAFALGGCATTEKITNYTDRSTVYAWINMDDVDGNHLMAAMAKQYRPATKYPYHYFGYEKMDGGYLLYSHGFPNGSHKLRSVQMQSCILFLCSNTINEYSFGSQGSDGGFIIKRPGVYFLGSYDFKEIKTGFFEAGKFEVLEAKNPPSQKKMIETMIKTAPTEHPIIAERLSKKI